MEWRCANECARHSPAPECGDMMGKTHGLSSTVVWKKTRENELSGFKWLSTVL